jgi:D-alanyl-D-alanine carboxypeptidase/D-alanyl-D-alanine-endopeptidase (penicillin-binding protein 4)
MLYKLTPAGAAPASYEASAAAERMFLTTEAGVDGSEFKFADGSGLSAQNLVTPNALVKVLRWMDQPSRRGVWWQLLAAPGEEGTLRRRLLPLAARLRGKTGSISGVNSLSGIVRGTGGGTRYFSIVLNHHTAGSAEALRAIDAIANAIADF